MIRITSETRLAPMTLSARDREILAFERSWWAEPGTKDVAVAHKFGLLMAEYNSVLVELMDSEEAMEVDPLVVRRLQRQRDRRRRSRGDRRVAGGESL